MKKELIIPSGFVWIEGYKYRYMINKEGKIYSYKRQKIMKIIDNSNNKTSPYPTVNLYKRDSNNNLSLKNFRIHYLLAKHFLKDSWFEGAHVSHIDNNPHNFNLNNLRWVKKYNKICKIIINKKTKEIYHSIKDCSLKENVKREKISIHVRKMVKNPIWEYCDK